MHRGRTRPQTTQGREFGILLDSWSCAFLLCTIHYVLRTAAYCCALGNTVGACGTVRGSACVR